MISEVLGKFTEKFNADLDKVMQSLQGGKLVSAMRYSATNGGKRLRPFMVLLAGEMGGMNYDDLFPLMVGVELVHTYSLVHDDLPCMDDDEFRRGKKSTHALFGEAMGVLAGDALLNYAYEYMLENAVKAKNIGGYIMAIQCIMARAGYSGMLGGQSFDIDEDIKKEFKREDFINMNAGKCGALFQASVGAGALASGMPIENVQALLKYGMYLGIAFQLKDDLADLDQDDGTKNGKKPCLTILSTFTPESAKEFIRLNTDVAIDAIKDIKGSENLVVLAKHLLGEVAKNKTNDEKPKTN